MGMFNDEVSQNYLFEILQELKEVNSNLIDIKRKLPDLEPNDMSYEEFMARGRKE